MFLRRVAHHFHEAGWSVDLEPRTPPSADPVDLVVSRRGATKAVLVREEPPGPFEVARFGAACKKMGVPGILVCPDDAAVVEFCEQAGLEFLPGEGIGEVPVIGAAPPPPPPTFPERETVTAPTLVGAPTKAVQGPGIPWWRWAIVAAIWTAALALLVYDLIRFTS